MENIEPSEVETYKCDRCSFSTRRLGSYDRHKTLHSTVNGKRKIKTEKRNSSSDEDEFLESSGDEWNHGVASRHLPSSGEETDTGLTDAVKRGTNGKFSCPDCDFATNHNYSLKRHRSIAHFNEKSAPIRTFPCDQCNFVTKRSYSLQRHRKHRHFNVEEQQRSNVVITDYRSSRTTDDNNTENGDESQESNKVRPIRFKVTVFSCDRCDFKTEQRRRFLAHEKSHLKKFRCQQCNKDYSNRFCLERHLRSHTDKRPYKCRECDKSFSRNNYLRNHVSVIHQKDKKSVDVLQPNTRNDASNGSKSLSGGEDCLQSTELNIQNSVDTDDPDTGNADLSLEDTSSQEAPAQFACDECDRQYKFKHFLVKHKRSHSVSQKRLCEECGKECKSSKQLWKHKQTHAAPSGKSYPCDKCSYVSHKRENVKQHQLSHVTGRDYLCDECGINFKLPRYLINHKKACHVGERPFKCDQCDFSAKSAHYLKVHERVHSEEKPYRCGYCNYACKHKTLLKRHERSHTGEKPYKCSECQFETHLRWRWLYHRASHVGHKLYKCDQCPKSFMEKRRLEQHKLRHTGETPYKCPDCDATFLTKISYDGHRLTHTSDEPQYLCDNCGKAFYNKISLSSHVFRVHSELSKNRVFKCDVCDATFKLKHKLKEHGYSHTGEKPHKCDRCSYATRILPNLHKHKLVHSGNKPYKCDVCDYRTGNRSNLTTHQKMHMKLGQSKNGVKSKAASSRARKRKPGNSKSLDADEESRNETALSDRVMRTRKRASLRVEPPDDDEESCDTPPDLDADYSPPLEVDRNDNENSSANATGRDNSANDNSNNLKDYDMFNADKNVGMSVPGKNPTTTEIVMGPVGMTSGFESINWL